MWLARCWGSEGSGPPCLRLCGVVGGFGFLVPRPWCWSLWVGVSGVVWLLFENCIVDASIFVFLRPKELLIVLVVLIVCVGVTSFLGHSVDALAPEADEGRRSLR